MTLCIRCWMTSGPWHRSRVLSWMSLCGFIDFRMTRCRWSMTRPKRIWQVRGPLRQDLQMGRLFSRDWYMRAPVHQSSCQHWGLLHPAPPAPSRSSILTRIVFLFRQATQVLSRSISLALGTLNACMSLTVESLHYWRNLHVDNAKAFILRISIPCCCLGARSRPASVKR